MERHALSARAIEREYRVRRDRIGEAVRTGELPAARLGSRRFTILRRDFEAWLSRHPAARPASHDAVAVVRARIEREERRA